MYIIYLALFHFLYLLLLSAISQRWTMHFFIVYNKKKAHSHGYCTAAKKKKSTENVRRDIIRTIYILSKRFFLIPRRAHIFVLWNWKLEIRQSPSPFFIRLSPRCFLYFCVYVRCINLTENIKWINNFASYHFCTFRWSCIRLDVIPRFVSFDNSESNTGKR